MWRDQGRLTKNFRDLGNRNGDILGFPFLTHISWANGGEAATQKTNGCRQKNERKKKPYICLYIFFSK